MTPLSLNPMPVRFLLVVAVLFALSAQAQTATVEILPVSFSARTIAPDGSAIGGTWTRHVSDEGPTGTSHYYHHFPAVWVDGQVHLLHLPGFYIPNEDYEPVNTWVVAVSADAEVLYGNARSSGQEPGGNPGHAGVVRWDGVDGAMTFVEGLPYVSQVWAASPDGSVIAGYGPESNDPLSDYTLYRWEDGVRTELQGYLTDTHVAEVHGVTDEGRAVGTRTARFEPYHVEAVWWEPDGSLTVGEDLGPGSIEAVSDDGASRFRSVRFSDPAAPAMRYRDGEATEVGNAIFQSKRLRNSALNWGINPSSVSGDGSRVYTGYQYFTPGSGTRGSTELWVEGVGSAPILDVLAERYGVDLPACPDNPDSVWGVMSSDGRVLTVECPESRFESPELDEVLYRITLPATAAWAEAADGFFDDPDRWAPALVPDSTTLTALAPGGPYTVSLREDHALGALTAPAADANLLFGEHTLTVGAADSASAAPAFRVGADGPAVLLLEEGALRVRGGATIGEGGEGTGEVFVTRGHQLSVAGPLVVGAAATDGIAGNLLVGSGSVQAGGGLHVGVGEGATGRVEALPETSVQATARASSVVGGRGTGDLYAQGAFVSLTGSLTLGGFASGTGGLHLSDAAFVLTTEDLFVGLSGSGSVGVASGSTLSTGGTAVVGADDGAVGFVSVHGAGSRWDVVNGVLGVGLSGAGAIQVTDGGALCVAEEVIVGDHGAVITDSPLQVREGGDCTAPASATRSAGGSSGVVVATLTVEGDGEVSAPAIEVGPGGVLDGGGALAVPLTNGGTLAPGGDGALGTLTLTAPLTQTAEGTLSIEVGASSTDAITVDGAVTLRGTLRLASLPSEPPTVGQSYDVLTASSITGAFDRIEVPDGLVASVSATAVTVTVASAVDAEGGPVRSLVLHTPSPNPSRGSVELAYELAESGVVRLSVHDALGRQVASVLDGLVHPAGSHTATLAASAWAPGVYVVRLVAGDELATVQLTVVR
ncbi:MAG: hypothetical protein Rubg2KO_29620 [Rubricoccaceae bacterium]